MEDNLDDRARDFLYSLNDKAEGRAGRLLAKQGSASRASPQAPGWASLSTARARSILDHGQLALPREMVEDALNALDLLVDTCDFRDGRQLKANVYLQRTVPVVQDWLPAGCLHPYAVQ